MNWDFFFDNWGVKTFIAKDIAKRAYVPNAEQRQALNAAGFLPAPDSNLQQLISVNVLLEPGYRLGRGKLLPCTTVRESGTYARSRTGTRVDQKWLKLGDTLLLANIGRCVHAL